MKSRAFTLIELLVVVLIIGVLAAVALPQYQKAVNKSKIMQLVVASRAIQEAQRVYYLENNAYAQTNDKLAVSYPVSGTTFYKTGKGTCDLSMANRVNCQMSNPIVVIQREYNKESLICCSYSEDNYAGEDICKLLKPKVQAITGCGGGGNYCHCYY